MNITEVQGINLVIQEVCFRNGKKHTRYNRVELRTSGCRLNGKMIYVALDPGHEDHLFIYYSQGGYHGSQEFDQASDFDSSGAIKVR